MIPSILPGPINSAQYSGIRFLNKGGMGEVYLAQDNERNELVAIKIIDVYEPEVRSLLEAESKIALQLDHPNVAKTHFAGSFESGGIQYVYHVMAYYKNGNLYGKLQSLAATLSIDECVKVMKELAIGLQYAHKFIIHRDIKPQNVLIGDDNICRWCDFGLAKYVDALTRSQTFKGGGTIPYMSPECWLFDTNTIQMDVYSLGILFFEILTNQLPFKANTSLEYRSLHLYTPVPNILDIRSDIPIILVEMIGKMTNKPVAQRYTSMDPVVEILQSLLLKSPPSGGPAGRLAAIASRKSSELGLETGKARQTADEKEFIRNLQNASIESLFKKYTDQVDMINEQLEQEKISFRKGNRQLQVDFLQNSFSVIFFPDSDIGNYIKNRGDAAKNFQIRQYRMLVNPIEPSYIERDKISLIGYAEVTSGSSNDKWSYNLLLQKASADDLYGTWTAVWFSDSGLAPGPMRDHYGILLPAFYQEYEFGRGNVTHVRKMFLEAFGDKTIVDSLEKLLG